MSTLRDKVKELRERARNSWDFDAITKAIAELEAEIAESGLIDLEKQRFQVVLTTIKKETEERRISPEHLLHALESNGANPSSLSEEQGNQLIAWFFKVINAGHEPTPFTEIAIRALASKFQGNAGTNKSRMTRDFEKFSRLAEIGPDPERSERNLKTMLVAARVSVLPEGFNAEIVAKCNSAIELAAQRKAQPRSQLLQSSLDRCKTLVEAKWQDRETGRGSFLEQGISNAIHISLYGIEDTLKQDGEAIEDICTFREDLDMVRGKFAEVRYPSSTTIKLRFASEIESVSQSLAGGYYFDEWRRISRQLRSEIKKCKQGQRGINWMHSDHVKELLSQLDDLDSEIHSKEQNSVALDAELRLMEAKISEIEAQQEPVSPGLIKRLGQHIRKDAPLVLWIHCIERNDKKGTWTSRLAEIRNKLNLLWSRMEAEEEMRIATFLRECAEVEGRISTSVDLRGVLQETMEMHQSVADFTNQAKSRLTLAIDRLFQAFRKRAHDCNALSEFIQEIHRTIDAHHRKIYSQIDFEDLQYRTAHAMQWVQLRDFPRAEKRNFFDSVRRVENEISKLRFRQEKAFREREQRGQHLMKEFAEEIDTCVDLALASPKNPEFWTQLADLDRQLRVNWRILGDERGETLRARLNTGFDKIKAARTQFAIEAGRVFAEYSEVLNDTLFNLEEEASREAALAAIDRIKPLRATLRTETRLLRHQRQELILLLNNVSSAIDEVFAEAKKASSQEISRIKLDLERLEQAIQSARDWNSANAVIAGHKALSAKIREADLSMAGRRELRIEMLRVWDLVEEKLDAFRASRSREERLDDAIRRLERQGYLMVVGAGKSGVPAIA